MSILQWQFISVIPVPAPILEQSPPPPPPSPTIISPEPVPEPPIVPSPDPIIPPPVPTPEPTPDPTPTPTPTLTPTPTPSPTPLPPNPIFKLPWNVSLTSVTSYTVSPCFNGVSVLPYFSNASLTSLEFGNDGYGNSSQFYPREAVNKTEAIAKDRYFQVIANFNPAVTLSTLNLEVIRGGSSAPRGIFIQAFLLPLGGGCPTIDIGEYEVPSNTAWSPLQWSLPSIPIYQVTFKIYAWAPNFSNSLDFRNFEVLGDCTNLCVPG